MRKIICIALASALLSSCTSMLLSYKTDIQLKDNKTLTYEYTQPVDTSSTALFCALTGIYYGGWCWSYFALPFSEDRKKFIMEAHQELDQKMRGRWYLLGNESISRIGYQDVRFVNELRTTGGEVVHFENDERPRHKKLSAELEKRISDYYEDRKANMKNPDYTMFAYGDLGTDFSYHGSGFGLGYKWVDIMADIGIGIQSRKLLLGNPFSINVTTSLEPFFVGAGMSIFKGSGERDVEFKDDVTGKANISWEYLVSHFSAGTYLLQNSVSNYQITVEIGGSLIFYDNYKLISHSNPEGVGQTPEGIIAGDNSFFSRRVAKEGIGAPFIRLAMIYWFRSENRR